MNYESNDDQKKKTREKTEISMNSISSNLLVFFARCCNTLNNNMKKKMCYTVCASLSINIQSCAYNKQQTSNNHKKYNFVVPKMLYTEVR